MPWNAEVGGKPYVQLSGAKGANPMLSFQELFPRGQTLCSAFRSFDARTKLFKFLFLGHACPPTFRWHRSGMRVGLDATVCLRGSLPSRIAESQPNP